MRHSVSRRMTFTSGKNEIANMIWLVFGTTADMVLLQGSPATNFDTDLGESPSFRAVTAQLRLVGSCSVPHTRGPRNGQQEGFIH